MPLHLFPINKRVNYRYMSYPPAIIKDINKSLDRVLLEVNFHSEKFTKWVHWTSIDLHFKDNRI